MPPEHRSVIELRRLLRDSEADAVILDALRAEISVVDSRPGPLGHEAAAYLAVKLHAWYTAFESILERIARVVEGGLPGGPSYHQDLLRGMALPLAAVRPAVIDPKRLGISLSCSQRASGSRVEVDWSTPSYAPSNKPQRQVASLACEGHRQSHARVAKTLHSSPGYAQGSPLALSVSPGNSSGAGHEAQRPSLSQVPPTLQVQKRRSEH